MKELPMTGERMVTSFNNHFGKFEHLHRYALALEFTDNKTVLDVACGEGYGTNLISLKAKSVIGIDISDETINHAKEKYANSNLLFKKGSASNIPCLNNYFDVAVSFETIEHLKEQEEMFSEIKRVLKKDGIFIISSPEKDIYHLRDANNIYHIKELTTYELISLVKKYFKSYIILKQQISVGSLILPIEEHVTNFTTFDGDFYKINKKFQEYDFFNVPFFNIVICSDYEIKPERYSLSSIFNSYEVYNNALFEKDQLIENLKLQLNKKSLFLKILKYIKSPKKIINRILINSNRGQI